MGSESASTRHWRTVLIISFISWTIFLLLFGVLFPGYTGYEDSQKLQIGEHTDYGNEIKKDTMESDSKSKPRTNREEILIQLLKIKSESQNNPQGAIETNETHYGYRHAGNFRNHKAQLWDTNPEYEFEAFGRRFHLILELDDELVSPDLKVTYVSENSSVHREPGINTAGCFYSGIIKGEVDSAVSVSLCDGMRGHIYSEIGGYFVEPVETAENNADTFFHRLWPILSEGTSSVHGGNCAVHNVSSALTDTYEAENLLLEDTVSDDHTRKKRSVDEYTVELKVVVDKDVADFHGPELEHYILLLMNSVKRLFKSNSIGFRMNIEVVNFTVLNLNHDDVFEHVDDKSSRELSLLNRFCSWQIGQFKRTDGHVRYDSAIFITRGTLCGKYNCTQEIIGHANTETVCQRETSCAVIKENGFLTAFTIAHELGHVLSMPHDNEWQCEKYSTNHRVMAAQMKTDIKPWVWSNCSKHHLKIFLQRGNVECLLDKPNDEAKIRLPDRGLGEFYNLDKQCEMAHGRGSKRCGVQKPEDECNFFYCMNPLTLQCSAITMPGPGDGTPCGDRINYWCQKGQCTRRNHRDPAVHGGWGPWKLYTPQCSRSCGGGVKTWHRECDNPTPSETGNLCKGDWWKYESCNTHDCPPRTPDFRAQQCSQFNNGTIIWRVYTKGPEKCKLYCVPLNHMSGVIVRQVVDGTPCEENSYDMCVNGKCLKAGCDHVLNSDTVLDKCGVCGGDSNTCVEIRKTVDVNKPKYGYNFIHTIPAGAWDLDVRQYSYRNDTDWNYLVLKDSETEKYVFNVGDSLKQKPSEIKFENIKFDYSGTEADPPERLNTSSRLPKNVVLEVRAVNSLSPFSVEYRYKIPNSQQFEWEITNNWSPCDKICFGEQRRIIRCIRKVTKNIVAHESCAGITKPPDETRICNAGCYLRWREFNRTECSSHCGKGTTVVTYNCYQEHADGTLLSPEAIPNSYCIHVEKPLEVQECYGSCHNFRWHYHEWEPCSVTCGLGVKTRRAECVDEHMRPADESLCSNIPKRVQESCLLQRCPYWYPREWSPCSVSCGVGVRKRKLSCAENGILVAEGKCSARDRPADTESCHMAPCPSVWTVGEWSQCSVTCGQGIVYRSVRCSHADESYCVQDDKPAETQMCFLPDCPPPERNDVYEWRTGAWGECSTTCGKGMKQRNVECFNAIHGTSANARKCDIYTMPSSTAPCVERPCPQWKTSTWNPCSTTCGLGSAFRNVWCELNGKRVADRSCSDPKPDTVSPCDTHRKCPVPVDVTTVTVEVSSGTWRTGRWGECSVSCGAGTKVRNVVCLDSEGNITSNCNDHEKPASSSPCNTNPCPIEVKWKYGDWSQCNQTCDGGYQHRQAQCYTLNGESVSDTYCNQKESPQLMRRCENNPCVTFSYKWKPSQWSECSVSCGIGVRTRAIVCEKINDFQPGDRETVDALYCEGMVRPKTEIICEEKACVIDKFTYKWVPQAWGKCSVTCGRGFRKRWIRCEKTNEARPYEKEMVDDGYCDENSRPKHQKSCRRTPCNSDYIWVSAPWGECHGPCSNKIKERIVQCYHKSGRSVANSNCARLKQPNVRRKCKIKKCDPTNCFDIKQKFNTNTDQDYTINVLGRNIPIYCHEMKSEHPKEFLSLPAGERENYSEFYSKRLINPETCPRSKYGCCVEERGQYVGRTVFSKIRLNVTSMQVVANDFTFARTSGTPVSFGEAGDCYSKSNCPQGAFSINLSGTGLQIASSVSWSKKGSYAAMDINHFNERRKVIGKCGGYCGTCAPAHGLKLDVLPP